MEPLEHSKKLGRELLYAFASYGAKPLAFIGAGALVGTALLYSYHAKSTLDESVCGMQVREDLQLISCDDGMQKIRVYNFAEYRGMPISTEIIDENGDGTVDSFSVVYGEMDPESQFGIRKEGVAPFILRHFTSRGHALTSFTLAD